MPGAAAAAAGDAEGDVREGPHTCCGGRTRGSSSLQHRAWGTDWSAVVWTSPWALRCSSLAHALPSFLPRRVRPTAAHLPGATSHQAGGVGLWHTSTRNLIPFYSDLCSAEMRLSHFLSQGGASSALGSRKPLLPSLPAHTPRAGAAHARAAPAAPALFRQLRRAQGLTPVRVCGSPLTAVLLRWSLLSPAGHSQRHAP